MRAFPERFLRVALAAFFLWVAASGASAGQSPAITIELFDPVSRTWHPVMVEVAETPAARRVGLMGRESLADDRGMLFVYAREKMLSFWMKDTYLSLDIMFFSSEGEWINTREKTTPLSLEGERSTAPASFALEMVAGSAERLNIGEGSRLRIRHCESLETRLVSGICAE